MSCILVADDGAEQLAVQRMLLEGLGFEVVTAMSPAAALEEIEHRRPDLIVVDLGIPRVADGLGLIRDIRKSGCAAPIVVLSGWPDDIYETPEEHMVARVLTKGDVRELLRTVADLLGD